MFGEWLEDLESLEAISQDAEARTIFSRMAAMSQEGRLGTFLVELAGTTELDEFTKGTLSEIAQGRGVLARGGRVPASDAGSALAHHSHIRRCGALCRRSSPTNSSKSGRSWIRTTDLRLIRAAL